eukprot:3624349-Rhodomonas_salina.2
MLVQADCSTFAVWELESRSAEAALGCTQRSSTERASGKVERRRLVVFVVSVYHIPWARFAHAQPHHDNSSLGEACFLETSYAHLISGNLNDGVPAFPPTNQTNIRGEDSAIRGRRRGDKSPASGPSKRRPQCPSWFLPALRQDSPWRVGGGSERALALPAGGVKS